MNRMLVCALESSQVESDWLQASRSGSVSPDEGIATSRKLLGLEDREADASEQHRAGAVSAASMAEPNRGPVARDHVCHIPQGSLGHACGSMFLDDGTQLEASYCFLKQSRPINHVMIPTEKQSLVSQGRLSFRFTVCFLLSNFPPSASSPLLMWQITIAFLEMSCAARPVLANFNWNGCGGACAVARLSFAFN